MSSYLKWSDTTIIIIAVIGNITGQFLTAFSKSMAVLWVAYVLWMLWNTITTISRSSITKFMASSEVGKAFSVLGVISSIFPFVTKPFFAFLYRETLATFPGAFRILTGSLYVLVFLLLIYTYFGMKKQRQNQDNEKPVGEEMLSLNNGDNEIESRDRDQKFSSLTESSKVESSPPPYK